jgi:hypothetical protein
LSFFDHNWCFFNGCNLFKDSWLVDDLFFNCGNNWFVYLDCSFNLWDFLSYWFVDLSTNFFLQWNLLHWFQKSLGDCQGTISHAFFSEVEIVAHESANLVALAGAHHVAESLLLRVSSGLALLLALPHTNLLFSKLISDAIA